MLDPDFHKIYSAALVASQNAGWYYSEARTRPMGDNLVLYFWKDASEVTH